MLTYASFAVHSAFDVGLLRAKITGLSLMAAISCKICGVKALLAADAPKHKNKHLEMNYSQIYQDLSCMIRNHRN